MIKCAATLLLRHLANYREQVTSAIYFTDKREHVFDITPAYPWNGL
jgi:hypothetical protein